MAKWQYRLRYTNYNWGEGGPNADWKDVALTPRPGMTIDLACHANLMFRRKPSRLTGLRRWLRYPTGRKI